MEYSLKAESGNYYIIFTNQIESNNEKYIILLDLDILKSFNLNIKKQNKVDHIIVFFICILDYNVIIK